MGVNRRFRLFFRKSFLSRYPEFAEVDCKKSFGTDLSCFGRLSDEVPRKNLYVLFQFHSERDAYFTIEIGIGEGEAWTQFGEVWQPGRKRMGCYRESYRGDFWWNLVSTEKLRLRNRKTEMKRRFLQPPLMTLLSGSRRLF
ncbi:hypothetical protein [Armatimonas sp.]|uniref:hypothetical protein n=1 Tax=Armatimonas sp. TaxID=1872638 RepID=UPI00375226CA